MSRSHLLPRLSMTTKALSAVLALALIVYAASLPMSISQVAPKPGVLSAKVLETKTLDLLTVAKSELAQMDKSKVPSFLLDKFQQNVESLQTLVEEIQGGLIENKILQYSTMILTARDGTQLF
eukprot:34500_3